MVFELCATPEEGEFDKEGYGDNLSSQGFEETDGSGSGSSGCKEIVDEEDFFSRLDGILVDFDGGFPVFEGIAGLPGLPWKLAFLTDRNESGPEAVGNRGGEYESSGIDADDLVDDGTLCGVREEADGSLEELAVRKNGCDVLEDDARLGEIRNIADGSTENFGIGHGADLLCAISEMGKEEVAVDAPANGQELGPGALL